MPPKRRSRGHHKKKCDSGDTPDTIIQKSDETNRNKFTPQPDSAAPVVTTTTDPPKSPAAASYEERKQPKQQQDKGGRGRESQHRNRNRNRRGKQAKDDRSKETFPAVIPQVEGFKPPDEREDCEQRTASNSSTGYKANRGRLTTGMSGYIMTLKQLHDYFRVDASRVVEEATSLLDDKSETDARSATTTQSAPRTPSPKPLSRPESATGTLSTHLVLLVVTRLSLLLSTEARRPRRSTEADGTPAERRAVPTSVLREITLLCKLIAWYCLSTSPDDDASVPGKAGSRGPSGRTTPGATSARPQGSARPQHPSPSFSSTPRSTNTSFQAGSHEAHDLQGWLGSRMSVDQAAVVALPDSQLSEQLMRPVVEAVSRFSVYGIDPSDVFVKEGSHDGIAKEVSSSFLARGQSSWFLARGHANLPTDPIKAEETIAVTELRVSVLAALCAVLNRFPDTDFNSAAFLPLLFPNEDACAGPHVRHPLLTPIVWDPSPTSRSVAVLALTALLYKLQSNLQFAEEPKSKHQSFVSLATQGGTALLTIHDVVYWVIKHGGEECLMAGGRFALNQEGRRGGADPSDPPAKKPSLPCAYNDATLWFNVFSALSVVTPYRRCPHSLQVMLETLDSPILRQHLRDEGGLPFIAATGFLANVFKNESLRVHVSEHLYGIRPSIPLGGSPEKGGEHGKNVDDGSYRGVFLINDLLVHAKERVEVWRCLVHIARFYPKLIQQHFESLIQASCDTVAALLQQEAATLNFRQGSGTTPTPQGGRVGGGQAATAEQTALNRDLMASSAASTSPKRDRGRGGSSAVAAAGSASPEAFVECLRAWTHFIGYIWKAFDNNPGDPALKNETPEGRATLCQKNAVLHQLILPAMRLETSEEVRVVTLRCLAQIGEDCLASDEVSPAQREEIVRYALTAAQHWSSLVRAESLMTLGVWVWQYPVLDPYNPAFLATALSALTHDSDGIVRSKAAFAVSNLTSRLWEPENPIRESVEHIDQLFFAAMRAVTDPNTAVQGHGIRMINNLLQVLTFEELIADLPDLNGGVEECVAEGFLRTLLTFLSQSSRDAKHRWNAAYALGTGFSRTVLFEAELNYTLTAIDSLMTVVVRDSVFKVRSQAAHALGKIAPECFRGQYCPPDLAPRITRTLCVALMSAKTTENFLQFREQATLQAALVEALRGMIAKALPSPELDKVLVEYHQILVSEGIE
ncbi:unnamed protein product [Phytomonas sp. EM1]|nr:unnamed protein product [Phytomonas sp. EM1]|eukprot:CCW62983.1 unnamed protein product [Phytomonas sp. isolate EM1]